MRLTVVLTLYCLSHYSDLAFIFLVVVRLLPQKFLHFCFFSPKGELTEWADFIQHLALRPRSLGFKLCSTLEPSLPNEETVHEQSICIEVVVRSTNFTLKCPPWKYNRKVESALVRCNFLTQQIMIKYLPNTRHISRVEATAVNKRDKNSRSQGQHIPMGEGK